MQGHTALAICFQILLVLCVLSSPSVGSSEELLLYQATYFHELSLLSFEIFATLDQQGKNNLEDGQRQYHHRALVLKETNQKAHC